MPDNTNKPEPLDLENVCRDDITPDLVREFIDYEPVTGALMWRLRRRKWFRTDRQHKIWNGRFAGKAALNSTMKGGYKCGFILDVSFQAHRVAFAHHHGRWPNNQIDHINGDTSDNRIVNLRDVTNAENGRNQKLKRTNKTGVPGVGWCAKGGKWTAQIRGGGKIISLGRFDSFDQAVIVRREAERTYGYHPNHGRTAAATLTEGEG